MSPKEHKLVCDHIGVARRVARASWPHDPDEAESVAMVALCEAAEKFDGGPKFIGWLAMIIRRRLMDESRKVLGRYFDRELLSLEGILDGDNDSYIISLLSKIGVEEAEFDGIEAADYIKRLPLENLSEAQMYDLVYKSVGYRLHEIASSRGVSESAVCLSLQKAKRKIKEAA